jgi:Holliday junction resolvase RusA-like endonuclease
MTTFEIPGAPVAKERPRYSRKTNTWYTPQRTKDYETHVAQCAMVAGLKLERGEHYSVEIDFHLSTRRFDLDNAVKSILDGLNRYEPTWDDRQVVKLSANIISVRDGSEEKTVVRVAPA